ncbi:replication initiation protein, partial [Acinetobacter baumannii]
LFSRQIAKAVVENRSPVFTSLSIFAPAGTGEVEFAERIARDLENANTAKRYYQALLDLGFKP